MAMAEILDSFAIAMAETRNKMKALEGQIEELGGRRLSITNAPPHADEIVAAFTRGLDDAKRSFEQRLGWYINNTNLTDLRSAARTDGRSAQLLMIGSRAPTDRNLFPHSALGEHQVDIDVAAVTYFLSDVIKAELPSLVTKLCPAATRGMTSADRKNALAEVDAEIARLKAERERFACEIETARQALYPKRDA